MIKEINYKDIGKRIKEGRNWNNTRKISRTN